MKKLTILLFSLLISVCVFGQGEDIQRFKIEDLKKPKNDPKAAQTPYLYLGPAMGINNYSGLIGSLFEVPIVPHFSAFMVGGVGGWGYKIGGGVLFYFREKEYLGSAFGLGLANTFGTDNFTTNLYLVGMEDLQSVTLNLHDAPTLNITYQYHMRMGRTSKFVIGTGYAFAMVDSPYTLVDPANGQISNASSLTMKMLQPGGLIISVAFQFGIGAR